MQVYLNLLIFRELAWPKTLITKKIVNSYFYDVTTDQNTPALDQSHINAMVQNYFSWEKY